MHNKVAVIVGGLYEGLCLAAGIRLASMGIPICIVHRLNTARSEDKLIKIQTDIVQLFDENNWPLLIKRASMQQSEQAEAVVNIIESEFGPIGYLLHGEGTNAYPPRDFMEIGLEEWGLSINRELESVVNSLYFLLPRMRKRQFGRVMSLAFHKTYWDNHLPLHNGHMLSRNSWPFICCKESRRILISQLAISEYRYGITLNTISPGRVQNLDLFGLRRCLTGDIPTGVTSWNVANVVAQICSDNFSSVTGADIPVLNTPITYTVSIKPPRRN